MSISQEHRYYLKLKALYYLYEEGYTQTEIAKQLNISRVTLSRLLEEAKAEGMIKFEIVDVRGAMKTLQLEEKLRQRFGLQDIKLVDCSGADTDTFTRKIGSEAASYFEQLVHNNMKIGLTWGRTLNSMIENLPNHTPVDRSTGSPDMHNQSYPSGPAVLLSSASVWNPLQLQLDAS